MKTLHLVNEAHPSCQLNSIRALAASIMCPLKSSVNDSRSSSLVGLSFELFCHVACSSFVRPQHEGDSLFFQPTSAFSLSGSSVLCGQNPTALCNFARPRLCLDHPTNSLSWLLHSFSIKMEEAKKSPTHFMTIKLFSITPHPLYHPPTPVHPHPPPATFHLPLAHPKNPQASPSPRHLPPPLLNVSSPP